MVVKLVLMVVFKPLCWLQKLITTDDNLLIDCWPAAIEGLERLQSFERLLDPEIEAPKKYEKTGNLDERANRKMAF